MHQTQTFELAVEARIPLALQGSSKLVDEFHTVRYELSIGANGTAQEVQIIEENLWLIPEASLHTTTKHPSLFPFLVEAPSTLLASQSPHVGWLRVVNKAFNSEKDYFRSETTKWNTPFKLGPYRSALANLPEDEGMFPVSIWFRRMLLDGVQKLMLNSTAMRRPSPPGQPSAFQVDGSNLPWVVERLRESDTSRFNEWVGHLRTVIRDLRTIETIERPEDRHRYLVLHFNSGLEAPCWLVSDGTLRLLALTLLAYLPGLEGTFLIEEPENGIHPMAVDAVLQALSSVYDAQVLLATHSPVVVSLVEPGQILCFSRDSNGATTIVQGNEHPRLQSWQEDTDLGTLFAGGVLS